MTRAYMPIAPCYDDAYMEILLKCHSKRLKMFKLTRYECAALDVAKQQNLASQSTTGTSPPVVDTEPSTSVHQASEQLTGTDFP